MRVWPGFLLVVLTAGLSTGSLGIEEGEYKCESALAHVKDCCKTDVYGYQCISDGCGHVEPDLTIDESDCIRHKSCDELKAAGVCDSPHLGGTSQVDHYACDTALNNVDYCCPGAQFKLRWTCQAPSMCGVVADKSRLLTPQFISCVEHTLKNSTFGDCTALVKAGVCNTEALTCE